MSALLAGYDPLLALDRDVFPHVAAYDPLLALDRDVFPHVAAYDPLLALDRYVFPHVAAYDPLRPGKTGSFAVRVRRAGLRVLRSRQVRQAAHGSATSGYGRTR